MKSRIETEATEEIVRQVAPKILAKLQDDIHGVACVSIHRAAGMLEVSPETIKRLCSKRILHLGSRQQRVTLSDLKDMMELHRTGERPKAKKKASRKAKDTNRV